MRNTDRAWNIWGEKDPYFAVLTDPKFRNENFPDHEQEFFRSGEEFVGERIDSAKNLFRYNPGGRALDFGCGVGSC